MAKELSGFKKSAPSSYPNTRDQENNATSAWDIDLSPFHRILDEQNVRNQQVMEVLSTKWDELLNKVQILFALVKENEAQRQQHQTESTQSQTKSNQEVVRTLEHVCTEIMEFRQTLTQCNEYMSNLNSNQNNLVWEQIGQNQNVFSNQLQALTTLGQEIRTMIQESNAIRQQTQTQIYNILVQIPTQPKISEQFNHLMQHEDQLLTQIINLCTRINMGFDNFSGSAKKIEQMCETWEGFVQEQKRIQKYNTRVFWLFIAIALVILIWFAFFGIH